MIGRRRGRSGRTLSVCSALAMRCLVTERDRRVGGHPGVGERLVPGEPHAHGAGDEQVAAQRRIGVRAGQQLEAAFGELDGTDVEGVGGRSRGAAVPRAAPPANGPGRGGGPARRGARPAPTRRSAPAPWRCRGGGAGGGPLTSDRGGRRGPRHDGTPSRRSSSAMTAGVAGPLQLGDDIAGRSRRGAAAGPIEVHGVLDDPDREALPDEGRDAQDADRLVAQLRHPPVDELDQPVRQLGPGVVTAGEVQDQLPHEQRVASRPGPDHLGQGGALGFAVPRRSPSSRALRRPRSSRPWMVSRRTPSTRRRSASVAANGSRRCTSV